MTDQSYNTYNIESLKPEGIFDYSSIVVRYLKRFKNDANKSIDCQQNDVFIERKICRNKRY